MSLQNYEDFWSNWLANADQNLKVEMELRTNDTKFKKFNDLLNKYNNLLTGNKRILEVGCGTAINSFMLAFKEGTDCYAMDISERSIELARSISSNFPKKVNLFVGDAENINYPDGYFDIIFSQGVMEHFKDYTRFMNEHVRLISENGYIIISVPQKFNPYTIYKHKRIRNGIWEWGWETEYSLFDFRRISRQYGLNLVEAIGYGYGFKRDYGLGFVRDLPGKVRRRLPGAYGVRPISWIMGAYDLAWRTLEEKYGAYFLVDIAVVMKKK